MRKCDVCKMEYDSEPVVAKPCAYEVTYSDNPDKVWETLDGAIIPYETGTAKEFCSEACAKKWISQQEENFTADIHDETNNRDVHYGKARWEIR